MTGMGFVEYRGRYVNVPAESIHFSLPDAWSVVIAELARSRYKEENMHVTDEGAVVGSIDRAALAEIEASDADAKAQLEQLKAEAQAAEEEAAAAAETPEPEPEPEAEVEAEVEAETETETETETEEQPEEDLDALRAQAEALGIKVDGRWGAERLRQEIDEAGEG